MQDGELIGALYQLVCYSLTLTWIVFIFTYCARCSPNHNQIILIITDTQHTWYSLVTFLSEGIVGVILGNLPRLTVKRLRLFNLLLERVTDLLSLNQ